MRRTMVLWMLAIGSLISPQPHTAVEPIRPVTGIGTSTVWITKAYYTEAK
jgi:hypothetical protein